MSKSHSLSMEAMSEMTSVSEVVVDVDVVVEVDVGGVEPISFVIP